MHRAGDTVVRRNVLDGRVWTAIPTRSLGDGPSGPAMAHWPGVGCRVISEYAASRGDPDPRARLDLVEALAEGRWSLSELVWERTTVVTVMLPDEWCSVSAWFDAAEHRFLYWYVNFEVPMRRTWFGFDTSDLIVDLVVDPDGTARWKDEDEYAHARRVGFITDEQDREVVGARERAIAMVEEWAGPFGEGWEDWTPDPTWSLPSLPPSWEIATDAGDS